MAARRKQPHKEPARWGGDTRDTDVARELLCDALEALRRQLGILDARQAEIQPGGFDPKLADAIASCNRAAAGSAAELRKLEAHDRNAAAALSDEERDRLVFEYARQVSRDRRDAIRALFDELDAEDDPLGL